MKGVILLCLLFLVNGVWSSSTSPTTEESTTAAATAAETTTNTNPIDTSSPTVDSGTTAAPDNTDSTTEGDSGAAIPKALILFCLFVATLTVFMKHF